MKTLDKTQKRNKYAILVMMAMLSMLASSCLKKDLPDYPLFDGNSITVVNAEHRFKSRIKTMYGEPIVVMKGLTVSSQVDEANAVINVSVTVPAAETGNGADFTAEEKANVKQNALWFYYTISTAATLAPLDGTAKPGDPADATKPLKYRVTAANGKTRDWVINVVTFKN